MMLRELRLLLLCFPLWGNAAPREIVLLAPKQITPKALAEPKLSTWTE